MIGNIIASALVLWAVVYCGFKFREFIMNAGMEKPLKCTCSSCPYIENKG